MSCLGDQDGTFLACARDQTSSSLVEVADGGGCAATDFVGAAGLSRAGVRRAFFAGVARCGGTRRSPRYGAGGCRVGLRSQPPTHPATLTIGAKSIIPARRQGVPNGAIRNPMFRAFRKNRIGNAPRSKGSSRPSNASSPRVHPDAAWPPRSAKPCYSVWPTISTI